MLFLFEILSFLFGYWLYCLEVFNWGIFDKYIWEISFNGQNVLFIGDIGFGKFILVDVIMILLVLQ